MNRRDFLKATGAFGLFVTFPLSGAVQEHAERPGYPKDFNAYFRIGPDGRVGCFVGKVEMGQGAMTALAMLAAEELDVPLERVDMLMGDTDLCPWDQGTWGSLSVWQFGPVLRGAAAEARAVLLQLAAERLGVPVERLQVQAGIVSVSGAPARRVGYGELVQGKRIEKHLADVKVKPVAQFTQVGKDAPRKDGRAKVTGTAKFAADILPPGTLQACLLRPPAHGARLLSVDTSEAEKLPGVRIIREGDLLAVLHVRPDGAREALGRVKAKYQPSPSTLDDQTIFEHLLKAAPPARELVARGSLLAGEALAVQRLDATYLNGYVAHAPMEPHTAVAQWDKGRMTVWASTQAPFLLKGQLVQALGLKPREVRVITPYLGGGFGGKGGCPPALEAARLARLAGVPVQVTWSRREEFFLDSFRPAAVVKVRAGLDKGGRIAFWEHHVVAAGDQEAQSVYDLPHQRIQSSGGWMGGNPPGLHPFAIGAWRAPAANTNVHASESHMDALAALAKVDPLEFRLKHLKNPRMVGVLKAAAKAFGWTPKAGPSGRGFGVACADHRDTLVAAMAEVAVDKKTGEVQVKRVVVAQDMGVVVHPDGARQQVEGCVTMGLGYALTEEVRFKNGQVLDENFDTYRIPRFAQVPLIQTILIDNPGLPAQGGGEPAIVVMGALIANAIHDAVGIRLLQLPMTPERVKQALKV
ncbi:MAG: xanthine dehydrogenase family protein molybdopterin-binding subunit [Holophagaceae bacterium]|uniref:Xanthine dehydrogenase family protein molybdopterin-binding subunit n=1 Tax=Candidatus Geothrix skivensis TaxID=2954439 RepID=A0A9D7XJ12_9BACT|nr:xanthine dehydrogenase family protein molybdopterin-binding subunit [Candidatus Geothrix skivensis]